MAEVTEMKRALPENNYSREIESIEQQRAEKCGTKSAE